MLKRRERDAEGRNPGCDRRCNASVPSDMSVVESCDSLISPPLSDLLPEFGSICTFLRRGRSFEDPSTPAGSTLDNHSRACTSVTRAIASNLHPLPHPSELLRSLRRLRTAVILVHDPVHRRERGERFVAG